MVEKAVWSPRRTTKITSFISDDGKPAVRFEIWLTSQETNVVIEKPAFTYWMTRHNFTNMLESLWEDEAAFQFKDQDGS